jgi:hypothetical protein
LSTLNTLLVNLNTLRDSLTIGLPLAYLLLKKGRWSAVLEFGGRRTVRVGAVIG